MRYFLIPVIVLFAVGCDCAVNTRGVIADRDTHIPIDSAEIRCIMAYKSGEEELDGTFYSDSNGNFYASGLTNKDGFGKCAAIKLEIIKDGYLSLRLNERDIVDDTIFMVRQ